VGDCGDMWFDGLKVLRFEGLMGKKAAKKDYDRLKKPLNPPFPSTFLHSNPSQKNISNIYLWINLWITISKGTLQTIISDQMYLFYT
jgi:hypothetical protein